MNARSEFGCKCTVYSQWELFPESFLKILFTGNSKVSSTISKKYFDGTLRTNDIVCCYSSPPPPKFPTGNIYFTPSRKRRGNYAQTWENMPWRCHQALMQTNFHVDDHFMATENWQTSWNLVKKVMFPLQRQLNSCRFVFLCNDGVLSHMVLVLHGWKSFSDTSGPAKRQLVVRFHSTCYSQSGVRVLAKKKKKIWTCLEVFYKIFSAVSSPFFTKNLNHYQSSGLELLVGSQPFKISSSFLQSLFMVTAPPPKKNSILPNGPQSLCQILMTIDNIFGSQWKFFRKFQLCSFLPTIFAIR